MMEIYIGLDWSKSLVCAFVAMGGKTRRLRLPRTVEGIERLLQVAGADPTQPLRAVIEQGDRQFAELLHARGVLVHVVDPKKAKRFAESLCSSRAKDDWRDARMLCELAASERHRGPQYEPTSPHMETLELLSRAYEGTVVKRTRVINQLRAHLRQTSPALEASLKDFTSKYAMALISLAPSWQHGARVSEGRWEEFCNKHRLRGAKREGLRLAMAKAWRPAARSVLAPVALVIRALVEELRLLHRKALQLQRALEQHMANDPTAMVLRSVDGLGLHISTALVEAGIGKLDGPRDAVAVATSAAPVTIQSGNSRWVVRRTSTSKTAAKAAFALGAQAIRRLVWAKAMYRAARERGQTHGTAVRRVARSLLRVLRALIRNGQRYDEALYIRRLQARGVPWALTIQLPPAGAPLAQQAP